ncbi:unnamed protein product (macronuclear) [Paramecium tetraurelia]|uniref:Band 7 domain-containing protein n=1 Tax=Paramecium tetraurelia TaxID=5888 RepID=A0EF58_PARTE|nr:uncharacterized protein GSPATT00026272001 [Paramecium tetraurelia]CAK93949.1 unnamed protein product [Paramecium tetraurelia]|eukprot:XP_001461322.1 hypothetical protein (macronuclear) [Paramecium tetraurelia strain d4-2]
MEQQPLSNNRQSNLEGDQLTQKRELTSYESCLDCCGNVSGCLRAWLPCIFCCCDNPFYAVQQSSVGLVEKFGKYHRSLPPGLNQINPCTDTVLPVDLRTRVLDLDRQIILTKDNIQVNIDTCMYFRVVDPVRATYRVSRLTQSVKDMTYAALRQVCGEHQLQDLLEHREMVQDSIEAYLDKQTEQWGIYIEEVFIKDMVLTPQMQSDLAAAAKNKRIAQAKVISAQADVESAKLMKEAAQALDSKAAMQIRFLETLQLLAKGPSQKLMFLPLSPESQGAHNG